MVYLLHMDWYEFITGGIFMNNRFISKVFMISFLCISPATVIICCNSSRADKSRIELVVAYEFTRRHFDAKLRQACADIKRENPGMTQDSLRACFEKKRAEYKHDIFKYASTELQEREGRAPVAPEKYWLKQFPEYLLGEKLLPEDLRWALSSHFMDRYMLGKSPVLPTYDIIMDPNLPM